MNDQEKEVFYKACCALDKLAANALALTDEVAKMQRDTARQLYELELRLQRLEQNK